VLQEFQLSITTLGDDRYLIRTEDMVDGVPVAEAQVQWPVDEWLKRSQPAMDDPILGLLQGRSAGAASNGSDLIALGKDLYAALFQDESIRESWHCAQGIAQHSEHFLRLRLGFKDSRLQRLPWEVLHHKGRPLATRTTLTFTRYSADLMASTANRRLPMLPKGDEPLRVLMVVASPDDQTRLNLRQEVQDIQQVLAQASGPTRIHITVLEQPDRSALTQALEQGNHQILHYAGHSDFGETGGDLHLVNQHTGLTEKLSGEDLAGLLVNNSIYLAVFNSCRSGQVAGDDDAMDWRQQNLVQALLHGRVPSVIAMAERIPDQVAMAFTQMLYKNITRGYPIDLSLGRTRQALVSAFSSDQHYWALPVLYMQPVFDGFLTDRDRAAAGQLHPWNNGDDLGTPPPPDVSVAATDGSGVAPLPPTTTTTESSGIAAATPATASESLDPIDDGVASLVAQLSQPTPATTDDRSVPAAQEETLLPDDRPKAGLDIYDVLPDNPNPESSRVSTDPPALPEQERHIPAYRPGQAGTTAISTPQQSPLKSLYIWLGIGFAGLTGLLLLVIVATESGWFATGRQTAASPTADAGQAVSSNNLNNQSAEVLIDSAERAIEDGRFPDAEASLEKALTIESLGKTEDGVVTAAVTTIVAEAPDNEFLFLRGRLEWQQIRRLGTEHTDASSNTENAAALTFAQEALNYWEQLPENSVRARVAQGFAYYFLRRDGEAERSFESARDLVLNRIGPDVNPVSIDPYALYGYAGLVMHYYRQATEINPEAQQSPDLQDLDELTANRLEADSADDLAEGQEEFRNLRDWDEIGHFEPSRLTLPIGDRPETWPSWLWTPGLLQDWQETYDALNPPA
jgi:tetratricopeptide (TPR) repeat protein